MDLNDAELRHGGEEVLRRLDAAETYEPEPAGGNGQAADEGHPDDEPAEPPPATKHKAKSKRRERTRFSHLDLARSTIDQIGDESVICVGSGIWIWSGSVWELAPDRLIKQEIHGAVTKKGAVFVEDLKKGDVDSTLDLFKTEAFRPGHSFDCGGPDVVSVLNGELHLEDRSWTLKPHCREAYRTSQIPIVFDPAAKAARFRLFLEEVFKDDEDAAQKAKCVLAMIGYCLLTTTRFERFFILIGRGANGKSVLLSVIEALLGRRNVSAVQPDQFHNKFQRAHMLGKLANIVTEIKQGAVIDDAALKAITSGELTTAEHKFQPPFDFRPHATCLFGTNHMPSTRDFSDAVFRRAVILEFKQTFEGEKKDTGLKDKLLLELPGILNEALLAIGEAIKAGDFTEPPSSLAAKAEWRKENDQTKMFLDERCALGSALSIRTSALYFEYRSWAYDVGIDRRLSQKGFTQRLKYHDIIVEHGRNGNILHGVAVDLAKKPG